MARYINLDEAIKYLHNDCKAKYPLSYANGLDASINELIKLPTADVVPKSEVVLASSDAMKMLMECHGYALTHDADVKKEVALEIFEEIEREINDALQSNYKILPQIEQSEALWNRVNGKIDALRGIDGFITELREKYKEGNNNDKD